MRARLRVAAGDAENCRAAAARPGAVGLGSAARTRAIASGRRRDTLRARRLGRRRAPEIGDSRVVRATPTGANDKGATRYQYDDQGSSSSCQRDRWSRRFVHDPRYNQSSVTGAKHGPRRRSQPGPRQWGSPAQPLSPSVLVASGLRALYPGPPRGLRLWQAFWAAWNCGLLASTAPP